MTDVNHLSHIDAPDTAEPDAAGRPASAAGTAVAAAPSGPGDEWTPLRRAAGAPRARSLLLTVLGEFVLPAGEAVWTSTLLGALAQLGVEEGAARQALARSSASDLLAPERVGRRTRWSLTARSTRLLTDGARRIYGFAIEQPPWDGQWLLVLTTVPEHNRHLRARMRSRMAWMGFGALSGGAWVTPWADREAEARATLAELGLADTSVSWVGRPGTLGSVGDRVGEIWDLDRVAGEYASFVAAVDSEEPAGDAGEFAALTRLVHDWRHFPAADPGLPAELLPDPWPGADAARTFHDRHRLWADGARRWWTGHCG